MEMVKRDVYLRDRGAALDTRKPTCRMALFRCAVNERVTKEADKGGGPTFQEGASFCQQLLTGSNSANSRQEQRLIYQL